jgi:hypothetical protein
MIAGIAIGAVLLLGGGGAAAWYFVAGPGSSAPKTAAPKVATPEAPQPAAEQVAATTDTSLEPLQAVPEETPSKTGQSTGGKSPSGKTKPKRCSFIAGEDSIGRAVRDALKAKETQIRACARNLTGEAAAKFSFGVAANAAQVSGVAETSSTGLEPCLKPNLAVSIGQSDAKARTGNMTISMKGRLGSELCTVQILTQEKSSVHKPEKPIDLGKTQDEIVSTVKDTLSQLRKKLEELKTRGTETDAGN